MKKLLLLSFVTCFLAASICAQDKQEKAQAKLLNKTVKNIEKDAKKEAKRLTKEGFKVYPGTPRMETALIDCYSNLLSKDDDNQKTYLIAAGIAKGQNNSAARFSSIEAAKLEIAGYATSKIAALVKQRIGNDQSEEAKSIFETIAASKTLIAAKLELLDPCFAAYKENGNGDIDVAVTMIYSRKNAEEVAQDVVKEEISKKIDKTEEELNQLLGF